MILKEKQRLILFSLFEKERNNYEFFKDEQKSW